MNKNYRVIWNASLRVFQVVSEITHRRTGKCATSSHRAPTDIAIKLGTTLSVIALCFSAYGANLYWSPVAANSGGNGTWDPTTNNWYESTLTSWQDGWDAVFKGTAGTVTTGAPVTAGSLTFLTTGYTLTGTSPITFSGSSPTITTASGVTATINAPLIVDNSLTLQGPGTLVLNGTSMVSGSGTLTASGGTVDMTGPSGQNPMDAFTGTFVSTNASIKMGNTTPFSGTGGLSKAVSSTFNNSTLLLSNSQANSAYEAYHDIIFGGLVTLNNTTVNAYKSAQGDSMTTLKTPTGMAVDMEGTNNIVWQVSAYQHGLTFQQGWSGAGTVNMSVSGSGPSAILINGSMGGYSGTINAASGSGWIQFNTADGSGWGTGILNVAKGATVGVNYNFNPLNRMNYTVSTATVSQPTAQLNVEGTFWSGSNLAIGALTGAATGTTHLATAGKTLTVGLLNNAADLYAGTLVGAGALKMAGTGTQILTGANTYTGGTTIDTGTIQLGNGGTTGSIVGNVSDNGRLTFDRSDTLTFTGVISGTGAVSQTGSGTTILTADSTYTGGSTVSAGTLQLGNGGSTGSIAGDIAVDANATLAIDHNNAFTLANRLTGTGLVTTDTQGQSFTFSASTGPDFSGTVAIGNSTFTLDGVNTTALTHAILRTDAGSVTTVADGNQHIGGLTFNGGTMLFDATAPSQIVADSLITAGVLNASGTGTIQINVPQPYTPDKPGTPNTSNLLQQDDGDIGVKLVSATTIIGSGGALVLEDQNGAPISAPETLDIAQQGNTVAEATYDYRLTTAPGDGLYVNYGLTKLDLQQNQTLTLAEAPGATGAATDMSAYITGAGNLAIDAGDGAVSLSNTNNDYYGDTSVLSGTLRAEADHALGDTATLHLANSTALDMNGTTQGIQALESQDGSTIALNGGTLNIANGGTSAGQLTGTGRLNVNGGWLDIQGDNAGLDANVTVASGATVHLDAASGLGISRIADEGIVLLDGVSGTFANALSGSGAVHLTNGAVVAVAADNSAFAGEYNIDSGTAMSVSSPTNLGTSTLADNGSLIINTATDWTLSNAVSGTGDLIKQGTGTLTAGDALNYTGQTQVQAGTLLVGDATTPNITLGGTGAGIVSVAQGAALAGTGTVNGTVYNAGTVAALNTLPGQRSDAASSFTLAGDLVNNGTVNLAGGNVGNSLIVKGNYTGNNATIVLNSVLEGDDTLTDKLIVNGDTSGNTSVRINNVGGKGAQAVNGIMVVEVDGQSNGTFTQAARIVAGAYDYRLQKKDNNWYLTNTLLTRPDAVRAADPADPAADPVDPPRSAPAIFRPESGSYTANLTAAKTMFMTRLHDRLGETQYTDALSGEKKVTSLWLRQEGGHNAWEDTQGQLNTQSNRYVIQLGGDIAQWGEEGLQRLHLGVLGGYGNSHSNTRSALTGFRSQGSVSGYSTGIYATWYDNDATHQGFYLDSWAQYGWFNNEVNGQGLPTESYRSSGITASLETGYTHALGTFIGSQGTLNEWFIQPQAQLVWSGVSADDHREHNGTEVSSVGDNNLLSRLGIRTYLKGHSNVDAGKDRTFEPFVEINWIHNTQNTGTRMDGVNIYQAGARNIGEVKTGVEGQLNVHLNLWGNVGVQVGDKGYNDTTAMVGMKYSF